MQYTLRTNMVNY